MFYPKANERIFGNWSTICWRTSDYFAFLRFQDAFCSLDALRAEGFCIDSRKILKWSWASFYCVSCDDIRRHFILEHDGRRSSGNFEKSNRNRNSGRSSQPWKQLCKFGTGCSILWSKLCSGFCVFWSCALRKYTLFHIVSSSKLCFLCSLWQLLCRVLR